MSLASVTDVCNVALSRIGQKTQITDYLSDTTTPGDLCRLHYPLVRTSLLRSHVWNFAIRRAELAQLNTAPLHEYTYQYALPDDFLKMVRTSWEATGWSSFDDSARWAWGDANVPYRIESSTAASGKRVLLTSESSVKIEYVADITDPTAWDSLFTDALCFMLAAELAFPLTQSRQLSQEIRQIAQQVVAEARTMDAQEGSSRAVVDNHAWLQVRV
jgi:hypothetical protein